MITEERSKILKTLAISKGLCKQWQNEWKENSSLEELIDKFYRGIDFYLSTRFVSKEQIITFTEEKDRLEHNIVVDQEYSLLNPKQAIAIGDSSVTVRCNNHHVCTLYACDNARVKISMKGNAFLRVVLCDNAQVVEIKTTGAPASVYVCRAGEHTQSVTADNVLIQKRFDLYKK